jgi:chorismate mutase
VRGIRGATTADRNDADAIVEATGELLAELIRLNEIDPDEVAFAYFTTTPDLDAEFPALAARRLGWVDVPLLCGHDLAVRMPNPRGITQCVRILVLYNTGKRQKEMNHVYLRGARAIKRDLDQYRTQLEEVIR